VLDSRKFLEKLASQSGDKVRIPIDKVWGAFQRLYPTLSLSIDARRRLLDLLQDLSQQGCIGLPKGKKSWEYATKPALPFWIEMFKEKEAAKPRMDQVGWPPEIAFASRLSTRVHMEVLLRVRDWLAAGGRKAGRVPLKERSAEIFGDEKRLDQLLKTDQFAPGALNLDILRCYPVYPDLIWEQGQKNAPSILIIENSNTYHSFCHWNATAREYAACVYGHGYMIHHTCQNLKRVLQETNSEAQIHYFGDLDATGIRIPSELSRLLQKEGLPAVLPAEKWYSMLLDLFPKVRANLKKRPPGTSASKDLAWFPSHIQERILALFQSGYRLPQEFVGTARLGKDPGTASPGL